jgi:hypothetical protein
MTEYTSAGRLVVLNALPEDLFPVDGGRMTLRHVSKAEAVNILWPLDHHQDYDNNIVPRRWAGVSYLGHQEECDYLTALGETAATLGFEPIDQGGPVVCRDRYMFQDGDRVIILKLMHRLNRHEFFEVLV